MIEFQEFQKIARLSRECTITEKIDGTNAQIYIKEAGPEDEGSPIIASNNGLVMLTGSRNRWITPNDDNFGFSGWVERNVEDLWALGPGHHYGEWWGNGIQRRYGVADKRFSLFNVSRWSTENLPKCCSVVPTLYTGDFIMNAVDDAIDYLKTNGSVAAPGFMDPEGIVVYHTAGRMYFKKTIKNDHEPKSKARL